MANRSPSIAATAPVTTKIPENIMKHISSMPWTPPPTLLDTKGVEAVQKWIGDAKKSYVKALMTIETTRTRLNMIGTAYKEKSDKGTATAEETTRYQHQREQIQKSFTDANRYVEQFRRQQEAWRTSATSKVAAAIAGTNRLVQGTQGTTPSGTPVIAPATAPSQQGTPQPGGTPVHLNSQTEAAKAQQQATATATTANRTQKPQQIQPQPAKPSTPVVGTPQSATSGGQVRPLSMSAAVNMANQNQRQQSVTPTPSTQTTNTANKMAIPKQLPERATQIPQPVAMAGGAGPGRPTYNAGTGTPGGVLAQPAIPKVQIPQYINEAEGDHVLSKKRLDELVRQVCGGQPEGQEGNILAPDVEESIMTLADSFIDNVLLTACRNAKERGSKSLETRDIQLVLERVYNIRIPGYSSDELRIVRKIQPSASWITKLSAVQAAKVTGKGE
ncbi:Transcription initiation factor TFIID subunit 12 [Ceratocystis fimbriata CBS 114723]|uniref:Transcription initiation factor TFIID subunit 12 n=1 Tax=Ceratocystis fimbriata CBS 114723 TaxID=1035309 RepID=A0A2C5X4H4_9PEZI|nr:Transcription initiation factor TFIID subunit 12 [Ceratocystis fimbriata CBS 114723]